MEPEFDSKKFERRKLEQELPAIKRTVYLNSAGQGPKPRRTIETVSRYYEKTLLDGACVKPLLNEINSCIETVREKAAAFLGVGSDEIAFIRCVAEGVNILLDGLDLKAGDEIITSYEENPAVLIPLHTFAEEKSVLIKKIELTENKDEMIDNLKNAITDQTRLVILSHVTHTRGLRIPAKEIGELCRSRGIWLALDGAQAAGQVPADCYQMKCDCYLAAGYKWLLGLHGTTIGYFSRSLWDKLKIRYNGVGSQRTFSFTSDEIAWKEGPPRLEYGSRCWPLYIGLGESLEYLYDLGIKNIEKQAAKLKPELKEKMAELGFTCESPWTEELSSGILTFSKKDVNMEELTRWLYNRRNVLVQYRNFARYRVSPQGLRISLGFFNVSEDVRRLTDGIYDYLKERG